MTDNKNLISINEYENRLETYKGFEGLKEIASEKLKRDLTQSEKNNIDNHYFSMNTLFTNHLEFENIFMGKMV